MRTLHSVDGNLARPGESVQDVQDRIKYGEKGGFFGAIDMVNNLIAKDKTQGEKGKEHLRDLIFESQRLLGGILEKHKAHDFDGVRKDIATFAEVGFKVSISDDNKIIYLTDLGPVRISWTLRTE